MKMTAEKKFKIFSAVTAEGEKLALKQNSSGRWHLVINDGMILGIGWTKDEALDDAKRFFSRSWEELELEVALAGKET